MKQSKLIPLLGLGLTLFLSKPHLIYANSGYGGGSGTETDPYLISTPEHLNQLQLDVNTNSVNTSEKYYRLTQDINLASYDNDSDPSNGNFTPIGYYTSGLKYNYFKGNFNGNGYTVSNLKIILPNNSYVGLFGYAVSATIQDLKLENIVIEGDSHVAGVVGYMDSGTINQIYSTGCISGNTWIGGVAGYIKSGTINRSSSTSDISGSGSANSVGGLVGYSMAGTINQSYSSGTVSGGGEWIGGLIGRQQNGTITQSYTTTDVSGYSYVGGFVGYQGSGTIIQSYAAGYVTGNSYTGGFAGIKDTAGTITNSYWDVEASGQWNSKGGVGLMTQQMNKRKVKENMVGFDFDTVWQESNGYPLLHWQTPDPISGGEEDLIITGKIETMVADVTIPSVSPDLVINPNLPEGSVSPEFSVSNDSVSPIKLELKTFEQTTNTFNDVLPTKYSSWEGLNKTQSQDIALGLVAKEGEGWQTLTAPTSYVANHTDHEIGIIKPNSSVDFSFDVKHGTSFSEAKTVQYKIVFVFDLMN